MRKRKTRETVAKILKTDVKDIGRAIGKYGKRDVRKVSGDIKERIHGVKRHFKKKRNERYTRLRREDYIRNEIKKRHGKRAAQEIAPSKEYRKALFRNKDGQNDIERSYNRVRKSQAVGGQIRELKRREKEDQNKRSYQMKVRQAKKANLPPPPPPRRNNVRYVNN